MGYEQVDYYYGKDGRLMSLTIYSGTPGSGKTLHAVSEIQKALNKPRGADRPVLANFPIRANKCKRPNAFHQYSNDEITPSLITDFCDEFWDSGVRKYSEDYILVVLDEVSLIFNSRLWNSKGTKGMNNSRMDWLEFFSQHRKYGVKVILIAQSPKMIDNQFRMLCDDEVNHRSIRNMGMVGGLLDVLTGHRLFLMVHYLFQTNERLGMRMFWRSDSVCRLYDTNTRLVKQV